MPVSRHRHAGPGRSRGRQESRMIRTGHTKGLNITSHKSLMGDENLPASITVHITSTVANPEGLCEVRAD